MHMADALLSPPVAGVMYGLSTVAAGVCVHKIKKEETLTEDRSKLPLMAVMSALVFSAQMINYTIPGTGSSGHICGGFLLSALLGPYAGFLSMIIVLLIQCLFFADGGLMALGANVWNMAFYSCFMGYYLIYRPVMKTKINSKIKLIIASVLGCILSLQAGAFSVVCETSLSHITDLPFGKFCLIMQPIHLAIGLGEGLITAAILVFINEARPEMLMYNSSGEKQKLSFKTVLIVLLVIAIVTGGIISLFASKNPDGLEWSLFGNMEAGYSENMGLSEESYGNESAVSQQLEKLRDKFTVLEDYSFKNDSDNPLGVSLSGIVGVAAVGGFILIIGSIYRKKREKEK